MESIERLTRPTVEVLRALLTRSEPVWGLEIVKETGLLTGTVYPILERLETLGWLDSQWEEGTERSGARRRFYQFSEAGAKAAAEAVKVFDSRTKVRTQIAERPI